MAVYRVLLPLLVLLTMAFSACGVTPPTVNDVRFSPVTITPVDNSNAPIEVAGSSTVGPITIRVREAYQAATNTTIDIPIDIIGSGAGFNRFCAGETDISNASRPIKEIEKESCAANGVRFIELPVAFDGIAVVTNRNVDFVDCLTVGELQAMWRPESERGLTNWNQVREGFPDQPLVLYGPGTESGTFDYFTEAIVGEEGESRRDFLGSEDDNILVDRISTIPGSLGFFGVSYYDENRDRLKLLSVDGGQGCVEPNTETVARSLYQPLSRPLFVYVKISSIEQKPHLDSFIRFYLDNAANLVDDVGYVPLTDQLYDLAQQRYDRRLEGSVFEGGANVGVSLADLLARELQE